MCTDSKLPNLAVKEAFLFVVDAGWSRAAMTSLLSLIEQPPPHEAVHRLVTVLQQLTVIDIFCIAPTVA